MIRGSYLVRVIDWWLKEAFFLPSAASALDRCAQIDVTFWRKAVQTRGFSSGIASVAQIAFNTNAGLPDWCWTIQREWQSDWMEQATVCELWRLLTAPAALAVCTGGSRRYRRSLPCRIVTGPADVLPSTRAHPLPHCRVWPTSHFRDLTHAASVHLPLVSAHSPGILWPPRPRPLVYCMSSTSLGRP